MEIGDFERDWERLFNPSTIAVVGASNSLGKWGFVMPMSVIGGDYRGRLFMVNPNEREVLGMPAYASLSDIDEELDLVIVTIPARKVRPVLEEAASRGVRNMLVVASNFSEVGSQGAALERELARTANGLGVTIIGPNTMGIFSASASLCALGAPNFPLKGSVGFISQSGNLGVQLLTWGKRRGVGFSRFVGSGNEANTEVTDYLEFLGADAQTRTIALYLEGLEDGRRFLEVASSITPGKPVIVLKGGKGRQGTRAVASHSGALAGSLELFQGMFERAGIVVADTSEEFIDLVTAFSSLPLPRGARVAVLTMGGGWGVVAADACDREGLELATLPQSLIEEMDAYLPSYWSRGNPVDLVGNLRRENHFKAIDSLARCDDVDMVVIMGIVLGTEFFINNVGFTLLRPLYHVLKREPRMLPAFMRSLRLGFRRSVSDRSVKNPEGSVGINPAELWNWTDSAFTAHIRRLMDETGKPIIAVAMSERSKPPAGNIERQGFFTAPTPERHRHRGRAGALQRFRDGQEGIAGAQRTHLHPAVLRQPHDESPGYPQPVAERNRPEPQPW
jgi:succinyl-CoA synthetase alpha subunit